MVPVHIPGTREKVAGELYSSIPHGTLWYLVPGTRKLQQQYLVRTVDHALWYDTYTQAERAAQILSLIHI